MKQFSRRALSLVLIVCVCVSLFASLTSVAAQNNNTRGTVCTALSAKAKSYYTGNYTYDVMSELDGGTSNCLTTVDSALFQRLHTLMSDTMTDSVTYKKLKNYWPTTDNSIRFYSNTSYSSGGSDINREHVWPKSRASFKETNGGCDLHHLRPTNSNVNSTRSNYTFGNVNGVVSGCSTYDYGGKTVLWYSSSRDLVEVNDNIKGDVARILLYVYVRWEEPNLFMQTPNPVIGPNDDANNGFKVIESMNTLLSWCEMDPVDTWEMSRNDEVQNVQGNRNVFIDYPEYAWLLFGEEIPSDMKTPSGEAANSNPYTLTALSNNTDYGTVAVSGKTVTATAKSGYEIDETEPYTLTPSDAATVTRSGNTFKVSKMTADCTLTVNFKERAAATITYVVPAGVTVNGATSCYVGDAVQLATVSGTPEAYTFVGWALAPIDDKVTDKPTTYGGGTSVKVSVDALTFYAVFSQVVDDTTYYMTVLCEHEHTETQHADPTCIAEGYDRVVCLDCGTILSETTLKKTAHDYQETLVAPTCTEKGYTLYECSHCHDSYKKKYTAALGHDYVDGTCTRCGADDPSYEPFDPTEEFTDIPSNAWYLDSVAFAVKNGLMNGMGNGEFQPDEPTTRAMVVTILYRLSGSEEKCKNPFTDVLDNVWYTDAVAWAYENGIVNGMTETTFEPDTKMNREMLAVILYRYTKLINDDLAFGTDLSAFPDENSVSPWAQEAMCWAVANGIINGNVLDGQTYLQPQANATRAQVAAIFQRYLENVLNK